MSEEMATKRKLRLNKIGGELKSLLGVFGKEFDGCKSKLLELEMKRDRFELAPVSRKETVENFNQLVDELAGNYQPVFQGHINAMALYPSKDECTDGPVARVGLNDFFLKGLVGAPGSWRIQLDAIAFFFGDVLKDRAEKELKSCPWPLGFDDGLTKEERRAKVKEIIAEIEEAEEELEELAAVIKDSGGTLE